MLLLWEQIYKENGIKSGVQLYKCYNCNRQFIGGDRINSSNLWKEYSIGKQTYSQLASKYKCSIKTIQRKLDGYRIIEVKKEVREVIVLMDTTYWGKA